MKSSYAFIETSPDVEAAWTVINQSNGNAVERLEGMTALVRNNLGLAELKNQTAQLTFIALRELNEMKTTAGVQTDGTNKINETFDKKVSELFALIDLEISYCDKNIKFASDELELPAANQYNRWRLSRVQLFATQALSYSKSWSTKQGQMYKGRLLALQKITESLVRFDTAQKTFLKSLEADTKAVTKKSLAQKPKVVKRRVTPD
ncbi:MAG: hypothetical protein K2Y22_05975 [Candidatus Obscuribacterales bacterium]|nr:hypothetical protein [Candidatus Obscuribacterales bacterium]